MQRDLSHIASRVFNTPVLMEPTKLDTVLGILVNRIESGANCPSISDLDSSKKKYTITDEGTAIIPVFGSLVNRGFLLGPVSGITSYEYISASFEDAVTDPNVSAIVLDIDSPGGEADGAFDVSDAIFNARGIKPIIASVNGMAASAAYAIASAADKIISTRTSTTGSVGVIAAHRDISEKNKKDGVKFTIVRAGDKKALLNPLEPLTDSALEKLQGEIGEIYEMFVDTVARNRNISAASIKETQADTFMGVAALELGFIDGIGLQSETLKNLQDLPNSSGVQEVASATISNVVNEGGNTMGNNTYDAEAKIIDLDSARLEGRNEATEIVQMCQLAGKPNLAADFLAKGMSASVVREQLLSAQATEDTVKVDNQLGDTTSIDYSSPKNNQFLALAHKKAQEVKNENKSIH